MKGYKEEKLGIREFSTMLLLIIAVKLSDTTPVLLFQRAKNAGWMLPIISFIVITPSFLVLLSVLKKYKDKNLVEIIYQLMGKFFGFVYSADFTLVMYTLMIIATRDVVDTITTMFYIETPPLIIYCLFMFAALFLCSRGLSAIGSVCWFIVPALATAASTAVALVLPDMKPLYIFPIGGVKPVELIMGIPFYASLEIEVVVMAILYPKVKNHGEYAKGSMIAFIIATILIAGSCLGYLMVFDVIPLEHIAFPFLELTRIIRIGRFISNAEAIFFAFWIMAACLRFSIYLYIVTSLFVNTIKKKSMKLYSLLIAVTVIVFASIPENFPPLVFGIRRYLLLVSFSTLVPLPYILSFLSKRKGEETG